MTSSSEGELLQNNQIIRERWKIKCKVGGGGFGEIYEANDLQNHNERVAVKVESGKATKQVLKMEVAVLRRLQGKRHACKFYGCGRNDRFNYLVMSLQGKNLADLRRESPKQCFSVSTAIRLGLQILAAIKEIHSIGFLHRDIKPSNFAMGRSSSTSKIVYMLDFGLARQYLNAKGEIRSPRSAAGFRGTVRYAAVSAHKNREMGRQDDLWSLFYMLVEFHQSALPWRKIKDKDEVGRMKDEVNLEYLLDGCPQELLSFATHLKTLTYPDEPDYAYLEKCLVSIVERLNIGMDDPYDWDLNYENISSAKKNANGGGATSHRHKSHTTAVKDRGPDHFISDDKNRNLETQAPITMGEDDEEQNDERTGNFIVKVTGTVESIPDAAKPKYKRQEFMKPKYGAVSFDVFDQVNARLAAANNAALSTSDLFNKMKVDVSIENGDGCDRDNELNVPNNTYGFKGGRESRSNKSTTFSTGYQGKNGKKSNTNLTTADGTNAIADSDEACSVNKRTAHISVSKNHDPYEEQEMLPHEHNNLRSGGIYGSRTSLSGGLRPFPRTSITTSPTVPTLNGSSAISTSPSSPLIKNNDNMAGQSLSRSPTMRRRLLPLSQSTHAISNGHLFNNNNNNISKSKENEKEPHSSSEKQGFLYQIKNFCSNVSNGAVNQLAARRRSLSRGMSVDDRHSVLSLAAKHSATMAAAVSSGNFNNSMTSGSIPTTPSSNSKMSTSNKPSLMSTKIVATTMYSNGNNEDDYRDSRKQRRFSRKRSEGNFTKEMSLSPLRSNNKTSPYHQTIILNGGDDKNGGYLVESRLLNNDLTGSENKDDKFESATSCRRKRYQFLNFSQRASTKS
uniref:Protein kinase domain-containing protein n=1 Tax=Rhabditophanes sp. KR3021 TaxID=114890 RepID=A0AC35TTT2_9BILA